MRGIAPLGERQFVEALRTRTETGGILLFVHGFGTTFEYAVFKAAQMAFDANFKGQVVVFSWPSLGDLNPVAYIHDQVAADTSSTDLERLFQLLKEVSGKHLYIVAHSLGNKLVLETLGMAKTKNINLNISELVMAAPDVDHIKYNQLAKSIKSVAGNMTMYASSADKALLASGKLSLTTRAGYIGADGQPNLCVGVEAIDVTAVGDDMLQINHDTSTASRMVLEDISELLSSDVHRLPDERIRILKSNLGKESIKYWYYPH
ncbi:alpha/beta fold hydrolase [Bradyrhizobium sp. 139]|uniref:alpha/beta hydrolase n=1 Tax=Bradyrhizobium sp. 139 TaxID=2782616 RepID=UPI001FFBE3AD|nr:alpha/beta fold hydrolase [Bradyrhizobium sp. 139]